VSDESVRLIVWGALGFLIGNGVVGPLVWMLIERRRK
jgi:hypothetical protein